MFHLGAQAHVGESWHRPYETVMTNTVGTLNLLQSIVDHGLGLEKFDTAGTSEEYGNVREAVTDHHSFDEEGGLILHERSPLNPKSIYATSKVAADFLTMNYHDAFGLPGVVTRMFNNYGPAKPAVRDRNDHHAGPHARDRRARAARPMRDFCFCTDGVRGHLMVAARGIPGDVYVYGQGTNISMRNWAEMILRIGREQGYWEAREIVSTQERYRPGASEVLALRVGYEKLNRETGGSRRSRGSRGSRARSPGMRRTAPVDRPHRLAHPHARARMRTLVTGGGGFLGSHLVDRLEADGHDVFAPRRAEYDLTSWEDAERLFVTAKPERVFHVAGEVGGIGANRASPGRFWYANLIMGAHVLELSRVHGVDKLVIVGTVCAYPKFTPVPFSEDELWNGYRRRRLHRTASRRSRSSSERRRTASSTASTRSSCCPRTSTARATTST